MSDVESFNTRGGRKIVSIGSSYPAPPDLSRRASRRKQKAWLNFTSPETAIRGRLAGADYSAALHAEQIVSGAYGKRGKKFEKEVARFVEDNQILPETAVARFMEHGHLGSPFTGEFESTNPLEVNHGDS